MTMRLRAKSSYFLAMLGSVAMISGTSIAPINAYAQSEGNQSQGPKSVADLAAPLLDAVVNIATTQSSKKESGAGPVTPKTLDDAPFKELFEDFFKEGDKGKGGRISSQGSGFVIDPKGYVVTNNHVIADAETIEVVFPNGKKMKAELVGTDDKTDLSVLKIEPKEPLPFLKFGDSRNLRIGDWVMAIGNPFGLGGSVSVGIVSARGRNINSGPYDYFIQTDAAINKGNSGGPLFNMYGEVIGVNTAIISPTGGSIGIGFAVPTELATNIIDQLIDNGKVQRGWLGLRLQPVTEDILETLGLSEERGALVSSIIESGPLVGGPIKAGDVITKLDGKEVKEVRDLLRIVAESIVGKPIDAELIRDGKPLTVSVSPAKLDDSVVAEQEAKEKAESGADEGTGEPGVEDLLEVPSDQPEGEGEATEEDKAAPDADSEREAAKTVLNMRLVTLSNDLRAKNNIVESVEGVLIDNVAPGSLAEQKGLKAGDVIVEVGQDFMEVPADVVSRISALKSEGRRNAHLMVANAEGDLRVVAIPLE
jgi:serine protease Do